MDPQERNDLMRQAAEDSASFGRLAGSVQGILYRFGLAQGLAEPDAVDAVQETLLRAWRKRRSYQPGRDAASWLLGFAMNVIREKRRHNQKHASVQPLQDHAVGAPPAGDETDDRLARLAESLDALPDRQREIIACRYLRQMSVRQTAEVLGIAEGTVKAATAAGLENLRKHFHHHAPNA